MNKDSLQHITDSLFQKQDSIRNALLNNEFTKQTEHLIEEINQTGWDTYFGIAFGVIGIIATIYFSYLSTKIQKNLNTEVNRLADINRPFHKTFPEIMNSLQSLFEIAKSNPKKSQLFIMNRTSAFGKIHSFNPKFYQQYDLNYSNIRPRQKEILVKYHTNEREILNDFSNTDDKCKYLFSEDVRKLYNLIEECSTEMPNDNFKLIVYDQENEDVLNSLFIQKYIDEVHTEDDIKNGIGLEYFTYIPKSVTSSTSIQNAKIETSKIKVDLADKAEITKKIVDDVISTHNSLIGKIRNGKTACDDENCWLKYSKEIPMQMYLLKTTKNGLDEYHTFIINAMSTKSSGNPDRYVDGIYSREQSLFSVFKTLFKETFKNNESFKD